MGVPKKITTRKPVKLLFVGGFLGSGKTTGLADLAKRLLRRGMRVGIITNDQTENLVDTVIVREMLSELGVPVELAGSGIVRAQAPPAGSVLPNGQRVRVQFAR